MTTKDAGSSKGISVLRTCQLREEERYLTLGIRSKN